MNGNPITITKTDTDILTIYATVYIHWNVQGSNGVKYVPSSHWFGTTLFPSGNDIVLSLVKGFTSDSHSSSHTYPHSYQPPIATGDASTKSWTVRTERYGVNDANCYGCIGFLIRSQELETFHIDLKGVYQITNEVVGTGDGVTTTFDLHFDLPYDVSLYVDGVLQSSGYTVYKECHYKDTSYFEKLNVQSTDQIHVPISIGSTSDYILYNPYHQDIAISKITTKNSHNVQDYSYVYASNDLVNWSPKLTNESTVPETIPVEYQHYKYWKHVGGYVAYVIEDYEHAIVFDNPPPAGSVITASYKTPFLPKDSDHVFDIGFTIYLGEYTPPVSP